MLRLDEEKTTHALGIASNFASGMMVNAGTMTKPLAAGQGARNGLLAALLAEKGLTSAVNALEDKRGFLPLYAKAVLVPSEIETVFADWGKPYEVEETAVGLKRHPCCGVLQSTIDVAIDLAKENDFTPDQIEGMDILLMTSRFGHVDRPHPKSGIDAKFSVQYCLARAIRDKGVTIADFEEGGYEDAGVAALMTKVHAAVNPSMKGTGRDQQGGADITVRLKDGRKFHGARLKPLGREAGKPLSDVQIDDKFRDCASRTVKREGIEPLVGKLRGLEILASIKQLSDFLFDVTA
jgi:2-methylcitrate dehydratase PrpD